MTATQLKKGKIDLSNFKGSAFEFTATGDEIQVDNVPNFRTIALNVQGLGASGELKIYGAVTHEIDKVKNIVGKWVQIFDSSGVNPFIGTAGNTLEQIDISGLSNVKLSLTGTVSANVDVQVSLSDNRG